jgi:hypothetical protein
VYKGRVWRTSIKDEFEIEMSYDAYTLAIFLDFTPRILKRETWTECKAHNIGSIAHRLTLTLVAE